MKKTKLFITIIVSILAVFLLVGCKKDEEPKPIEPSANEVKIVFDSNGGSKVDDIIITKNTTATLPKPTKEGYDFIGWFDEDAKRISASHVFTENMNLKAEWTEEEKPQAPNMAPTR